MSLTNTIQQVEFPGWVGGLNKDTDQFKVEPTDSPDALNVNFVLGGSVARRAGYTEYLTWSNPLRLIGWRSKVLGVDGAGSVFYEDAGAMTDSTLDLQPPSDARSQQMPYAAMNDALYLTQCEVGSPKKWDGSSWSNVTATVFDGTSSRFPRARALEHLHERIFAGNVLSGATAHPSRLHFSNALDPETWDALDFIEVAPDDGTEITALRAFGDGVLIFKDHSIFLLSGTDDDTFQLYPIDPAVGTTAPDTVVVEGGIVIFLDPRRGVLSFNGEQFQPLDQKINRHIIDGINYDSAHTAVAAVYENRYYLSVPWGAETEPSTTFVLDLRTGAWTEYDWASPSLARLDDKLIGAPAAGVFEMEAGDDDDGTDIDAYFRTAWIAPAGFPQKHRIRRMDLSIDTTALATLNVVMRRDMLTDVYIEQDLTIDPGGALWGTFEWGNDPLGVGFEEALLRATGWGQRWQTAQFKFAMTGPISVSGLQLQLSVHERKRGERI